MTAPKHFCIKSCSHVISLFLRLPQGVKGQKKITFHLWCLDHPQPFIVSYNISVKQEDIITMTWSAFLFCNCIMEN